MIASIQHPNLDILRALAIRLAGVLDPAGVLDGDGLAGGRDGTVALLDGVDGDAHFDCGRIEGGGCLARWNPLAAFAWIVTVAP